MGAIIGEGWTDERVDALTSLWKEGMSASQIARIIGGATRNSVIGKLHRLGLTDNSRTTNLPRVYVYKPRPQRVCVMEEPKPPPESLNLGLEHLTGRHCKYPHGDNAPFAFCGHPVAKPGEPWCEFHRSIVFNRQPASAEQIARATEARLKSSMLIRLSHTNAEGH